MRSRIRSGWFGVVGIVLTFTGMSLAGDPFLDDPKTAFRRAADDERPLLIDFHAAWCTACERMKGTTWQDGEVLDLLDRFVPLSVDGERSRNLAFRYEIDAYPTLVIAEPGGEPILVLLGYQSPEAMRDHLSSTLEDWGVLAGWAAEAARRRPDPAALVGLGEFARSREGIAYAEECYRRALREKTITPQVSLQARLGLAVVLATTDRCREAGRLARKADAAAAEALTARVRDLCGR